MKITECTVYKIGVETFDSEEKAREYEADLIGEFLESHLLKGIVFSPSDRLKMLDNVLQNRKLLVRLLSED